MNASFSPSSRGLSHSQKAWLFWGLAALFYFYQFILRVSPGVMSHELMRDFAVQGCALGVLGAFYYNAYAAMQIPLGILMDRFGPRRLIAVSCATAALGTYFFSQAETLALASFGRLLMGAGAACGFIGTIKLATLWFWAPWGRHLLESLWGLWSMNLVGAPHSLSLALWAFV
jgi:sugar phosphate permease